MRLDGSVRFEYATMKAGPLDDLQAERRHPDEFTVRRELSGHSRTLLALEFIGPKPAPYIVVVDGKPVHARVKLDNSFM